MGASGPSASEALPGPTFQVPHPPPFHLTSFQWPPCSREDNPLSIFLLHRIWNLKAWVQGHNLPLSALQTWSKSLSETHLLHL